VRPGRVALRLVILVLPVVLTIGGCGTSQASLGSPSALPPSATALASASGATATPAQSASNVAASSSTQPSLVVDARLLDVLPSEIDGVALEPDPTTALQIATDPTLAGFAEAIAVALAISPGTSSGDDLAISSVIRLRPGVFSDAWFRTWRTTYDAAACEVAGGIQGQPSEVQIGGRTAYVGTCAGDAHTYHVHLADPTLIVSITSAGPRGFGELVVAGLAE
jgi:hypothetical protein